MFEHDSVPCPDSEGNACTTAGCNGAGACDQKHVSKTCPGADQCNGGCDTTSGRGTPKGSTAGTEKEGNGCTNAGCEGSPAKTGPAGCVRNHKVRDDSTPRP